MSRNAKNWPLDSFGLRICVHNLHKVDDECFIQSLFHQWKRFSLRLQEHAIDAIWCNMMQWHAFRAFRTIKPRNGSPFARRPSSSFKGNGTIRALKSSQLDASRCFKYLQVFKLYHVLSCYILLESSQVEVQSWMNQKWLVTLAALYCSELPSVSFVKALCCSNQAASAHSFRWIYGQLQRQLPSCSERRWIWVGGRHFDLDRAGARVDCSNHVLLCKGSLGHLKVKFPSTSNKIFRVFA